MEMHIFRKIMTLLGVLICLIFTFPVHVLAEGSSATAVIEIDNQIIGDGADQDEQFVFVIMPEDKDFPVPDNGDTLTITGAGSGEYRITYTKTGEYTYTVKAARQRRSDYIPDDTVYHIKISVFYDDNGTLCTQVAARKSDADAKSASIVFKNKYTTTETENPATTEAPTNGDDKTNPAIVKTGDESSLILAEILLLISIMGLVIHCCVSKMKKG